MTKLYKIMMLYEAFYLVIRSLGLVIYKLAGLLLDDC